LLRRIRFRIVFVSLLLFVAAGACVATGQQTTHAVLDLQFAQPALSYLFLDVPSGSIPAEGADFAAILRHYYPETDLTSIAQSGAN
jgi:hypothetical protein